MTDHPPDTATRLPTAPVTLLRHGYATPVKDQPLLSAGVSSLATIARRIRSGPQVHRLTHAFRNTQKQLCPKHLTVKQAKSHLPAIIPSLALPPGQPVRNLPDDIPHTGLYVYDIDQDVDQENIQQVLQYLADFPHSLLAARSTSGDALYVILAGPVANSPLHHKLLWNAIHEALPTHIRPHAAPSQNNINRTRIIAHDPDCFLAAKATPIHAVAAEYPRRRNTARNTQNSQPTEPGGAASRPLQRNPIVQSISEAHRHTAMVRSALQALQALPAQHADNYSTWIITGFRLAGGQHIHGPAFKGKQLFTEFSRTSPRYQPRAEDAYDRCFLDWDGRASTAGIIAEARQHGWHPPKHTLGHSASAA